MAETLINLPEPNLELQLNPRRTLELPGNPPETILAELEEAFQASDYYKAFEKAHPRFYPFHDVQHYFTPSDFIERCGTDVSLTTHLNHATELLRRAIATQQSLHLPAAYPEAPFITTEERDLLLLGEIGHDWGEAIVGDVKDGHKTDDHETAELEAYRQVRKEIAAEVYPEMLQPEVANRLDRILFGDNHWPQNHTNRDHVLAAFRRSVEISGYMLTAVTFLHESKQDYHDPRSDFFQVVALGGLGMNVMRNNYYRLNDRRDKVVFVDRLLRGLESTEPFATLIGPLKHDYYHAKGRE